MPNTANPAAGPFRANDAAGSGRRRLPPLPLMALPPLAKAGLLALRVLLAATSAMAIYAALHPLHG